MHYVLDTQTRHKTHTDVEHKCHIGHHWHHHKSHNNVQYNYPRGPMWVHARLTISACVCAQASTHDRDQVCVCVSVHLCLCTHRHVCSHNVCTYCMSVCDSVTHIVTSKHHCLVAMADSFNKAGLQIASCISFPSLAPFFFFKSFVYFPQPCFVVYRCFRSFCFLFETPFFFFLGLISLFPLFYSPFLPFRPMLFIPSYRAMLLSHFLTLYL